MKMRRELLIFLILFGVIGLLPIGLHKSGYIMHVLIMGLIWAALVVNWDLMMGYCGIYSFAQPGLFVVGAYTSGLLAKFLGIPPVLGILIGGIAAGVAGLAIALPCLRLKGLFITVITFGFHLMLRPLIDSEAGKAIGTGGVVGLLGIPPLQILGYTFSPASKVPYFYVAFAISFAIIFTVYKIIYSKMGLAFTALHDAEPFAKSLGVDEYKYKLMAFGISAFLTGIVGGFYAHYVRVISTQILGLDVFLLLLFMLIAGGLGRFPGAVIGAFFVMFVSEWLLPLQVLRLIILGAILILFVLFLPKGLKGAIDSVSSRISRTFKGRLLKE